MDLFLSMKKSTFQFAKRVFFWVPMMLALTDLAFFIAVPILITFAIDELKTDGWGVELLYFAEQLSLSAAEISILLVALIGISRTLMIKLLDRLFSDSLSKSYAGLSSTLSASFFEAITSLKIVDLGRFRKVMNAEINNLFFGVLVPVSFALAEMFVVMFAISVLVVTMSTSVLVLMLPVCVFLVGIMLFMKGRSKLVGNQRAASEQCRLESVELLLNSGYSIRVNNGEDAFKRELDDVSRKFSEALSKQLVLPFFSKSIVEVGLMLVLTSALIFSSGTVDAIDLAILVGVGLRCVPALSRITAYIETIRINRVGAVDALTYLERLRNSQESKFENDDVMSFLNGISESGIFIIKGPSGIGKTSAIKKWISKTRGESVAYFDQVGFSSSSKLEDLTELLGITKNIDYKKIDFIKGRNQVKLSELSGGQARFIQLFALFSKEVNCFVLDEPSVGLDAGLRSNLEKLIIEKSMTSIVVVITHDTELVTSLCNSGGRLFEV